MRSTSAAAHRKSRAPSNLLKRLLCSAVAAAFALSATLAGAQFGGRATSSLDQNPRCRILV